MILLDTHMLVWMLIAPDKLSAKARKAIVAARRAGPLAISAISLWEIAWLVKHGRIETTLAVGAFVKRCASYVEVLPITEAIAVRSVEFPKAYSADPQDRIIGATAVVEGRPLLTQDRLIVKSGLVPLAG